MNADVFDRGPLAEVDYEAAEHGWTLIFVRDLDHPREKVWSALTEPEQLRDWAPFVADRNLGEGGTVKLTMVDGDAQMDLPPATVNLARRPELIEYTWGEDLLRWELEPTDGGTRLTLRHTVADRDGLATVAAGWHLCLVVAERLLDGAPIPPIRGSKARDYGWDKLHEEYVRRLTR